MSLMPVTYDPKRAKPLLESESVGVHQVLNEPAFERMIAIERQRTERSKEAFLLILFQASRHHQGEEEAERVLNSELQLS